MDIHPLRYIVFDMMQYTYMEQMCHSLMFLSGIRDSVMKGGH